MIRTPHSTYSISFSYTHELSTRRTKPQFALETASLNSREPLLTRKDQDKRPQFGRKGRKLSRHEDSAGQRTAVLPSIGPEAARLAGRLNGVNGKLNCRFTALDLRKGTTHDTQATCIRIDDRRDGAGLFAAVRKLAAVARAESEWHLAPNRSAAGMAQRRSETALANQRCRVGFFHSLRLLRSTVLAWKQRR
jgi:hypothetical protein